MRILLLSYHQPSEVSPAASRARKLGCFLLDRGHDVRVLSSGDAADASGFDLDRLVLTPSREKFLAGENRTMLAKVAQICGAGRRRTDNDLFWHKMVLETAGELFENWQPDVIYATCPPHSTALAANQLSKLNDIPFVAEFREPWDIPGDAMRPERRTQQDTLKERDVLHSASAIVTVSPLWAQAYSNRVGAGKVSIAMDGFDPAHYPVAAPVPSDHDRNKLQLFYAVPPEGAGEALRTLFDGMAALAAGTKDVRVTLLGDNVDSVMKMAREAGVHRQIDPVAWVSSEQSIELQYGADALIFAMSNDPRDAGSVPAELFDYIGTRRPLIAMGYSKGVAAQIIRKRDLGIFSNEPKVIANRLAKLLARKRAVGVVPPLPEKVRENATFAAQFTGIEPMLYSVVGSAPLSVAAE